MSRLNLSIALLASLAVVSSAAASGSLVGLYHVPADVTHCDLIRIDLATGANTTLFSDVSACSALTTNYPSFSTQGPAGRLLVAVGSAAAVFSVDIETGTAIPLGAIANNKSDIMIGVAHWPAQNVTVVGTQYGIWNASSFLQNDLLLELSGADAFGEAFVFAGPWPTLFVVSGTSSRILLIDIEAATIKRTTGLASPIGTVLNGNALLQEKGYVLYSTPAAGGAAKRVLSIPDGPGYPRTNLLAGTDFWVVFDFAHMMVADLKKKTIAIVGDGFVAAARGMGFPIYVP